jgi:hypothetical protein
MTYDNWKNTNPADQWLEPELESDEPDQAVQEQAAAHAAEALRESPRLSYEIQDLKKLLELRDIEIGALRREIRRRNTEIENLKTDIGCLCYAFEEIMEDDGHYPDNAPIRKLVAEARNKI